MTKFGMHMRIDLGMVENFKVTKHQLLKSISGMQLSWAKPGNPREGGREGRIGERGRREGGGERAGERVPSEAGYPASSTIKHTILTMRTL